MINGIENSKDVIDFISELAKILKAISQDGSIDLLDAIRAMHIMPTICAAIKDVDQIKSELMDLGEEEKEVLLIGLKKAICDLVEAFK